MPQSFTLNIGDPKVPNFGDYNFSQLLKETKKKDPKDLKIDIIVVSDYVFKRSD